MTIKRVLVPRLMDANNFNPQNNNAQNILSRTAHPLLRLTALHYNEPREDIQHHESVDLLKLWRWRFWKLSAWLSYQGNYDAILYPGGARYDDLGWRLRDLTGRRVPIISTLEGLVGNTAREDEYSRWAGHKVYCQKVSESVLRRLDRLYQRSDRIIAISPFLACMGRLRYGDKFSVLPLGIDADLFHPKERQETSRFRVIGGGRLYENKRPQLFLKMAKKWPEVEFVWFGDGELRRALLEEIAINGLTNISFPGAIPNEQIAEEFRSSSLFVLPSHSEGVPKVTQEAAACGLPVINFGFYEAPSVVDGKNGYVVWTDEELLTRVGELIVHLDKARAMGERGAEMAKDWEWSLVSRKWEETILSNSGMKSGEK